MSAIAIAEIISAIFVLLSLIGQFMERSRSTSGRRLTLLYVMTLALLLGDAACYCLDGKAAYWGMYVANLSVYATTHVVLAAFMYYCDACIREKTDLNRWTFIAPMLVLLLNAAIDITCFVRGELIDLESGSFELIGSVPPFVLVTDFILLFYASAVAFVKRKALGINVFWLLTSYAIPNVCTIAVITLTGIDCTAIASAVAVFFVSTILQKESAKIQLLSERSKNELIARMGVGESLYIADIRTERFRILKQNEYLAENYRADETFDESISRYIANDVFVRDRKAAAKALGFKTIIRGLETEKEYTFRYRDVSSGVPRWYEMRAVKISEFEILYGFADKDDEFAFGNLHARMIEDSFAIFSVDLDSGYLKVLKKCPWDNSYEAGAVLPYSDVINRLISVNDGDSGEFFARIGDLDYIRRIFAVESKQTYSYKSNHEKNGCWIAVTAYVTSRRSDGIPASFALCFSLLDTLGADSREVQRRLSENMRVIGGLASEYYSLYYVNLEDGSFVVYKRPANLDLKYPAGDDYVRNLGMYIAADVHPADRAALEEFTRPENIRSALSGQKQIAHVYRDVSNGTVKDFRCQIMPGDDEDHVVLGFVDATDEIRMQRDAQRQRYLKTFGDMVNAGLWSMTIDNADNIVDVYWSDAFRRMLGYEEGKEVFPNALESWANLLHPDDKARVLADYKKGISSRNVADVVCDEEYRIMVKSGAYRWFHALGRMEECGGGMRRLYGIITDITADKRLAKQLALSDGLAREYHTVWLVDGFGEHRLHLFRTTGKKTVMSAVQRGLDEPTYDGTMMKYVNTSVHVDDRARVLEASKFETVARETPDVGTYVVSYRRYWNDRGDVDYHQMCFARAVAEDGTVNYILAFRDADKMLREQIEQQHRLEDALSMVSAASKAKSSFLFNMSHDIRTPMNAIMGFTDIALKNLDDRARLEDCLRKTKESSGLLLSLINGVLDMSRVEAGAARVEENAGDVLLSFVNIESTMRELARARGVALSFEFGEITDRYVFADYDRCARVFVNLISNAIKYSKPNGHVKVRCEQTEAKSESPGAAYAHQTSNVEHQTSRMAWYRYTFEDDGIGMSAEYQKHLFEKFSRERNTTAGGVQGTGLGLALCKAFVDLMGGTIECRSEQGVGTKFTVTLPFRVQEGKEYVDPATGRKVSAGCESEPEEVRNVSFDGKRVLLAEDNEMNREVAEYMLKEIGFTVETAANGAIAVDLVRKNGAGYYDLVLMDIQMPVMDGYEATKAIRAWEKEVRNQGTGGLGSKPDHLPIVALSANAFAEDRAASIAAGMDDHVGKPVKAGDLTESLARFVKWTRGT